MLRVNVPDGTPAERLQWLEDLRERLRRMHNERMPDSRWKEEWWQPRQNAVGRAIVRARSAVAAEAQGRADAALPDATDDTLWTEDTA